VHELSDEDFKIRQHVRKIFRKIDKNDNGTIELIEFERLLPQLGIKVKLSTRSFGSRRLRIRTRLTLSSSTNHRARRFSQFFPFFIFTFDPKVFPWYPAKAQEKFVARLMGVNPIRASRCGAGGAVVVFSGDEVGNQSHVRLHRRGPVRFHLLGRVRGLVHRQACRSLLHGSPGGGAAHHRPRTPPTPQVEIPLTSSSSSLLDLNK
jgi:hypothetical protein